MNYDANRDAIEDVIYLASCAVNGDVPDAAYTAKMDLDAVYKASERHMMSGIIAAALESAGIVDSRFIQARAKVIRKNMIMQADMEALFDRLDKAGIWHMPLKGSIMEGLYPAAGMRQMADRDILIDSDFAAEVRTIMEEIGFTVEDFGKGNHDIYYKEPVSNFEIHHHLFGKIQGVELYNYYYDVKKSLIRDSENSFRYHFSNEDAYVYMVAHEYKHYSAGGTGLRSLLDTYVYCSRLGNSMDWDYVAGEIAKLGITEFEKTNKSLALYLFSREVQNDRIADGLGSSELEMLDYVIGSGTYGNLGNKVQNKVDKLGGGRAGKVRYVLDRLFPSMDIVNDGYPFFYRHKILLPILPFFRLGRGLMFNKKHVFKELKAFIKSK